MPSEVVVPLPDVVSALVELEESVVAFEDVLDVLEELDDADVPSDCEAYERLTETTFHEIPSRTSCTS